MTDPIEMSHEDVAPVVVLEDKPTPPTHDDVRRYEQGSLAFGLSFYQLLTIVTALLVTGGVSFLAGITYSRQSDVAYSEEFQAFWEAWQIIEDDYYTEPPSAQDRANAALNGLVLSLNDPYSNYFPPVQAEENREFFAGVFGGIGAIVAQNEAGEVYIERVMEGNPAERVGLQNGDIIRAVDGASVQGLDVNQVVELIRGEVGTDVVVTIYRPATDETLDFTVERAEIQRLAVSARMIDDIGYIYLTDFSAIAAEQMERELANLLEEDPIAIVFDLRGNPGGLLDQAVSVSDLFLDNGLVLTERNRKGLVEEFFSQDGDLGEDVPLVILMDGGTASASEIVAGALQDRGRAVLIGQPSFGKGAVQQIYSLSGGGELRITWAAWYTPNEQEINGVGLTPDILIEGDVYDAEGNDRYFEAARDYIDTHYRTNDRTASQSALFGG